MLKISLFEELVEVDCFANFSVGLMGSRLALKS